MKRYSEKSPCSKCGSIAVMTRYEWGTMQFDEQGNKLPDIEPYMARECARCHYGWREAPMDAPEAETKDEEKT